MLYKALLNKLNGKYIYTLEACNVLVIAKGTKEVGVLYKDKTLTILAPQRHRDAKTLYEGKLDNKLAETIIKDYLK